MGERDLGRQATEVPVKVGPYLLDKTPLADVTERFISAYFFGSDLERYIDKNQSEIGSFAFFARIKVLDRKKCKGPINIGNLHNEGNESYYYLRLRTSQEVEMSNDYLKRISRTGSMAEESLARIVDLQRKGYAMITGVYVGKRQPS